MTENIKATLTGVAPLLMHNGQLADPTNEYVKAIRAVTSGKKKTEENHLEIRRLEWMGGLYLDEKGVIAIPADCILALVLGGAKKNKNGVETKAGVYEARSHFKLEYDGPKDLKKLYETPGFCDYRGAVISRKRVMRARPIFRTWRVTIELIVDTEIIDRKDVVQALMKAGELVGLGDWRPRFGRFTVEVAGVIPQATAAE